MTIGTTISAIAVTANGVTTSFAYPFLIPFASDAVVSYLLPGGTVVYLSPTQYSITGLGNPAGGTVIYPLSGPPLAAGAFVFIARILPLIQATSLQNQGPTYAAIETEFDYQMMCLQQLQTEITTLEEEIASLSPSASGVGYVGQIANVAALSAYTGPATGPLWLMGYYNPTDGGEGMLAPFPSSTASPNGGTILADGLARNWYRETGGNPFSVKWFGAVGDGVTDDTAAIQACANAAAPNPMYVPSDVYAISKQISITTGIKIFGAGLGESVFSPSSATTALAFNTTAPVTVEDLQLYYAPAAQSSGVYAMTFDVSSSDNVASRVRDTAIIYANAGILVQNSGAFVMDGCFIVGCSTTCAVISSSIDVNITNCELYGAGAAATGLNLTAAGALRVVGNTITEAASGGILYNYIGTPANGGVVIADNEIFSADSGPAIRLVRSSTGTVAQIVISGNVLQDCQGGLSVPSDTGGIWVNAMAVTGNTWQGPGTPADYGFEIDTAEYVNILGNTLRSATPTTAGIVIGPSCVGVNIQGNNFAGSFVPPAVSVSATATAVYVLNNVGFGEYSVGQIANVAALAAYTGPATMPLWLLGYYNATDGGEGMFAPFPSSTASPNGGSIIADGLSRNWYRETGGNPFSVKWFGATGNGVTDDTAAIQACANAAAPNAMYVPTDVYRITAQISITTGMKIFGDGLGQSVISPSSATTCFAFNTTAPITTEDLQLYYPPAAQSPGVYAMTINVNSTNNVASRVRDTAIVYSNAGILVQNSGAFVMDGCFIVGFSTTGAELASSVDVDLANNEIYGSTSSTTAVGVRWAGAGGFRAVGNTITECAAGGILYMYTSTSQAAGGVLIGDNSISQVSLGPAVEIQRSSTGTLAQILIDGNEMQDTQTGLSVPSDTGGIWVTAMTVTGNAWQGIGTAADAGLNVDSTEYFNLAANTLRSATPTTTGITIGPSATGGIIQGNSFAGGFGSSTISVSATATAIRVLDNNGYNPVGSSTLSASASPWTYTAGPSPQTLYLSATTSINSVTYNGTHLLPVATSASAPFTVGLGPNESVVISYSGAMTANVMTH
jgi:pectate lyase-like protein